MGKLPDFDMCQCMKCNEVSKVTDCEADFGNHNGWELPPYTMHLCPKCPDGHMDDYFYSKEKLEEIDMENEPFKTGVPYTIEFTDEEKEMLEKAAAAENITVTEWLNKNSPFGTWSTNETEKK